MALVSQRTSLRHLIISLPDPKALGELMGRDLSWRPCVSAYAHPFTLSNIHISETGRQIKIKFHLEHYWGKIKAA